MRILDGRPFFAAVQKVMKLSFVGGSDLVALRSAIVADTELDLDPSLNFQWRVFCVYKCCLAGSAKVAHRKSRLHRQLRLLHSGNATPRAYPKRRKVFWRC